MLPNSAQLPSPLPPETLSPPSMLWSAGPEGGRKQLPLVQPPPWAERGSSAPEPCWGVGGQGSKRGFSGVHVGDTASKAAGLGVQCSPPFPPKHGAGNRTGEGARILHLQPPSTHTNPHSPLSLPPHTPTCPSFHPSIHPLPPLLLISPSIHSHLPTFSHSIPPYTPSICPCLSIHPHTLSITPLSIYLFIDS